MVKSTTGVEFGSFNFDRFDTQLSSMVNILGATDMAGEMGGAKECSTNDVLLSTVALEPERKNS
jgi:hypothetical protein